MEIAHECIEKIMKQAPYGCNGMRMLSQGRDSSKNPFGEGDLTGSYGHFPMVQSLNLVRATKLRKGSSVSAKHYRLRHGPRFQDRHSCRALDFLGRKDLLPTGPLNREPVRLQTYTMRLATGTASQQHFIYVLCNTPILTVSSNCALAW